MISGFVTVMFGPSSPTTITYFTVLGLNPASLSRRAIVMPRSVSCVPASPGFSRCV